MGRAPRELTPLESALYFFGAEVRHWRTVRELSQMALGGLTHDSGALISKVEKGERFPSLALARRLDEALATGGALARLWPSVERERATRAAPARTPPDPGESTPADLGLVWSASTAATVEVVGKLWRADLERRSVLLSAAWVASAFAEPIREWLLERQDEVLQERPGRTVGQSDIDALWAMAEAFTDADQRLGGGYARDTLMHYVNQAVFPLLHGSYTDAIGRELMAATGRLCDICGYMSFDSGRQGLAQRYYIQALRLAQASGKRALGAHVLTDMSDQAHHLGNATQALELAAAGYHTAVDCGSAVTAARCAAAQGEAHALLGEHQASAQAYTVAERTLDRATPDVERTWTKTFMADHLTTRRLFMARDLGRAADVQKIAPHLAGVLGRHGAPTGAVHDRTRRLLSACEGQLPPRRRPGLRGARPGPPGPLGSLHSTRSLERFNAVRRALAPHAKRPSVQEFEASFRSTVVAVDTRA